MISTHAGVANWQATLELPRDGTLVARATDKAGNVEKTPHEVKLK